MHFFTNHGSGEPPPADGDVTEDDDDSAQSYTVRASMRGWRGARRWLGGARAGLNTVGAPWQDILGMKYELPNVFFRGGGGGGEGGR